VKEPDLALNDRELAIDLEDEKLEELHLDLEDDMARNFTSTLRYSNSGPRNSDQSFA